MESISRDLQSRWMPALIAAWRKARKAKGPEDHLHPAEVREVGAAVKRLSHGLTRERELAGARYMDDPALLGAYLLFYWPVSYAQGRHALRELPRKPRSVLDLGAGPGPLAMAAIDAGAVEVTAADRSAAALDMARALAGHAGEPLRLRQWDGLSAGAPDDTYDLITLGHVVNELWTGEAEAPLRRAKLLETLLAAVKPKGSLLVVEPALRETSRGILAVRDMLVARGYAVRSPCLFRGSCPALVKETDWCHAERPWTPPPLVAEIARAAGLNKEALKMTYLVLAPKGEGWTDVQPGKRLFRIVSEPLASKGRLRYMGCGPEGRIGIALQEKHVGEGNRAFERLARGDVIAVDETEARGDGLALSDRSHVDVVAPAGKTLPEPWEWA